MIRRSSFAELLAAPELIEEYGAECSIPEIGPIDPQPEIYAAMEANGLMHSFAAMSGDSIVGFATVLTVVLPHYGRKVATLESIFVSERFRSNGHGIELMRAVEAYAKESGCVAILYSAPAGGQLERVLNKSRIYHRTNAVFCRGL